MLSSKLRLRRRCEVTGRNGVSNCGKSFTRGLSCVILVVGGVTNSRVQGVEASIKVITFALIQYAIAKITAFGPR